MSLQQQLPNPCNSEVALLLRQIDLEYTAAYQGLHGLASGSCQHEVITAKMKRMCEAVEQLKEKVGVQRALELTTQIMEHCSEQKPRRDVEGRVPHEENPA